MENKTIEESKLSTESIPPKEENTEKITPKEDSRKTPPMRRIVILTDGNDIKLEEAEVSGTIELTAILQNVINFVNQPKRV